MKIKNGEFWLGDCLDLMKNIPSGSIDMILCDLPYGTTQNKWDSIVDLDRLWSEYWRIGKKDVAIILTSAQPFTSLLVMSQIDHFKYDWVWVKPKGTNHLNAKKMPMRDKEDICVFYKQQCIYNPQFTEGVAYSARPGKAKVNGPDNYGVYKDIREDNPGRRYPKQTLEFGIVERNRLHPTQKPVALFEYLIKTYSNEGELILDNCAGSGTTAIAAENLNRRWLCIEKDEEYYSKAIERIQSHA